MSEAIHETLSGGDALANPGGGILTAADLTRPATSVVATHERKITTEVSPTPAHSPHVAGSSAECPSAAPRLF